MKALYSSSHLVKVFLFRIGIEIRPLPGGFPSSEALDAVGNRCNYLSHAHESHHVEPGDQQSQRF